MEIKDLMTKSDLAYPEVVIDAPNAYYAGLLQNAYAGCNSEISAILKYTYQHHIFEEQEEQIADVLRHIAIVEMKHLELLADVIIKLGGVPFYKDASGQVFSIKNCVDSTTNLKRALLKNIEEEEQAILNYNYIKNKINNASIDALISRIIMDEEIHKKTFETILEYISFYN